MEAEDEDEGTGPLSSATTSKSVWPTLQPTQTTGNLPPTEVPAGQAKGEFPLHHPRYRWRAGCSLNMGLCLPRKGQTHPLTVSSQRGWGQTPNPLCLRTGRVGRGLHQNPTWQGVVTSGARKPTRHLCSAFRGAAAPGRLQAPSCESRTRRCEEGV